MSKLDDIVITSGLSTDGMENMKQDIKDLIDEVVGVKKLSWDKTGEELWDDIAIRAEKLL
jgi:hypothetical protein